jgi:hypothetical protein
MFGWESKALLTKETASLVLLLTNRFFCTSGLDLASVFSIEPSLSGKDDVKRRIRF